MQMRLCETEKAHKSPISLLGVRKTRGEFLVCVPLFVTDDDVTKINDL